MSNHDSCTLSSTARKVVAGEGPDGAEWLFLGEAPGRREDWTGRPFVGPSGTRVDYLISLLGLERAGTFVTNVVQHRPPQNRKPRVGEIQACLPNLLADLKRVRPRVVVALGETAVRVFNKDLSIEMELGKPRKAELRLPPLKQREMASLMSIAPSMLTMMKKGQRQWTPDRKALYEQLSRGEVVWEGILVPLYHPAYTLRPGGAKYWPVMIQAMKDLPRLLLDLPQAEDGKYWQETQEGAVGYVGREGLIGLDTETDGTKRGGRYFPLDAKMVGFSLSRFPEEAIYVPSAPKDPNILAWLESDSPKVAHNTKHEVTVLANQGITLGPCHDTKIAAYLLQYPVTRLGTLTYQVLNRRPIRYEEVTKGRSMADVPVEEIVPYAAADADHARRLWLEKLEPQLQEYGLWDLYEEVELPLIPVLAGMERRGIAIDRTWTWRVVDWFEGKARKAEKVLRQRGFLDDLNSHEALARWLDGLGAPITDRTEVKGLPKTDKNTLLKLRQAGWRPDLVQPLLNWKMFRKLQQFPFKFLSLSGQDSILHPSFNQAGHWEETEGDAPESPASGRLSCSSPNLQQVPHHGKGYGKVYEWYGNLIRKCLRARPGYVLLAVDVAQQEPRITAVVANEQTMLKSFAAGIPIYSPMGEAIYGRPVGKRTDPAEWNVAKVFFLAKVYGAGPGKLVEIDPRLSLGQAERADREFDMKFPGLSAFQNRTKLELYEHGYVRDWFGRVRFLPAIYNPDRNMRAEALRQAINQKIQGPAATMIKIAMLRMTRWIGEEHLDAFLLLQVHDELVFEVAERDLKALIELTRTMLLDLMPIDFPVEPQVGRDWAGVQVVKEV